jgi:putative endonuclease
MVNNWFLYLLKCADNTFYTGITNNLDKRLETHNQGRGAKYTKGRRPVMLVYYEENLSRSTALKREAQMKKISRDKKLVLASGVDKKGF